MQFVLLTILLWVVGLGKEINTLELMPAEEMVSSFTQIEDSEIASAKNFRKVRQIITGTVAPVPGPTILPTVPTTTCTCLPIGSCPTAPPGPVNQIDIRIVTNPQLPTVAPSPDTCGVGQALCCQITNRCGIRALPNMGGSIPGQSPFGAYPWQAAILTSPGDVFLGSGALIDSQHILTVAHKVNNVPMTSIKVRLGEWDAATTTEPIPAQDYTVTRVFIHEQYNAVNLNNDVAILRLSSMVNLTATPIITSVCLSPSSFVNFICYVAGWGKNDFGPSGTFQTIQKQVDVRVKGAAQCQAELRTSRLGQTFVFNDASFICAGGENGKDACTGDGGSPLVCQSNGRWFVVGLVAWGIGCGTLGIPGVYVNVASYIPWIQGALARP